jgi:hypothetical protein
MRFSACTTRIRSIVRDAGSAGATAGNGGRAHAAIVPLATAAMSAVTARIP